MAIAHSAISRAQDLDGRLGSTTRKMIRLANIMNPLIFALHYQFVLVLTFIDDGFLATANIVEKIFPPSKLVFDKIDDLLLLIETLPVKFDDAVDKLPCFNQVPLLDWAVIHAISLLKFMIAILMNWVKDGTREKEILVDMNCNEGRNASESADMDEKMKSDTTKNTSYKEVQKKGVEYDEDCKENEKGTYKKAMEEGRKEAVGDKADCKNDEKKVEKGIKESSKMEASVGKAEGNGEIADHSNKEKSEGENEKEEEEAMDYEKEEGKKGRMEKKDDILELFETAWLMKPTGKGKGNLLPRSASYV